VVLSGEGTNNYLDKWKRSPTIGHTSRGLYVKNEPRPYAYTLIQSRSVSFANFFGLHLYLSEIRYQFSILNFINIIINCIQSMRPGLCNESRNWWPSLHLNIAAARRIVTQWKNITRCSIWLLIYLIPTFSFRTNPCRAPFGITWKKTKNKWVQWWIDMHSKRISQMDTDESNGSSSPQNPSSSTRNEWQQWELQSLSMWFHSGSLQLTS